MLDLFDVSRADLCGVDSNSEAQRGVECDLAVKLKNEDEDAGPNTLAHFD